MPVIEYWPKKLCGLVCHTFEIAGPRDVRHRIISALQAAGTVSQGNASYGDYREELLDLQQKLLRQGIEAPDTITDVKDWRINVFTDYYRKVDEPTFWGDIKPAGGLSNPLMDKDHNVDKVLQWKGGDAFVPPQHKGFFGARIRCHDIPLITPVLPWIALGLVLVLNSDKILRFVRWVGRLF
jgi:hypothetical protein